MTQTPRFHIETWEEGNTEPNLVFNELAYAMDALVQASVKDKDLSFPPGSPSIGDAYIVASSPTGAWSGKANAIAVAITGGWAFWTPGEGWTTWVQDESLRYDFTSGAWAPSTSGGGGVSSVNALTGAVTLVGGPGVDVSEDSSGQLVIDASGAVAGVSSVNSATGAIDLAAGANMTIVESPTGTFTFTATGGGGGSVTLPYKNFVDDYGADPTGATDCGTAWDAFVADVESNGSMGLLCDGTFLFSRAMQNTSAENAQMPLPSINYVGDAPVTVYIFGPTAAPAVVSVIGSEPNPASGCTVFKSTLSSGGGNMMAAFGPSGSFGDFSNIHLVLRNLIFELPDNPTFSGVNLSHCAMIDVDGVFVYTGDMNVSTLTQATTTTSYGFFAPKNGNGANSRMGTVDVLGFYNGYSFGEHSLGLNVKAWACTRPFNFLAADHASTFMRMMAVHCINGLTGPASGAHVVSIFQYDVEHAASGAYVPVSDVDDSADTLYGAVNWRVVLAGTGGDYIFTVVGAHNLAIIPLAGFPAVISEATTSHTPVLTDDGRTILFANASLSSFNIPPDSDVPFKLGAILTGIATGTGGFQFVAGSGVTVNYPDSYTSRIRYATCHAIKVGLPDTWILAGDFT